MRMNDKVIGLTVIAIVVVIGISAIIYAVMVGESMEGNKVIIGDSEMCWTEMTETYGTTTVDDKEGVPLGAMAAGQNMTNVSMHYVLKADDGYAMAVNWTTLQTGILIKEEGDNDDGETEKYFMTYFPNLPGAYRVRYLESIEAEDLTPIKCNGLEYHTEYMAKRVGEKTIMHNETVTFTGYSLSDMVNYTGLEGAENHTYEIIASDGYSKEVNWTAMMSGIVVDGDTMSYFPGLEKKYWVKDIIEIRVV